MNTATATASILLALAGLALPAAARPGAEQPVAPVAAGEVLAIRVPDGVAAFRVDAPDGLSSSAARDDSATLRPDGQGLGWTPGYRLTSRVIVRASGLDAAVAAVGDGRIKVAPARPDAGPGPMREFFYADAASVREAAALAERLAGAPGSGLAYLDLEWPKALRTNIPTDPSLGQQWHLINAELPLFDVNAEGAWKNGYTGTGVTVGVLEGGWDVSHEDLAGNHDAAASQPAAGFSEHGTSTAGLVAAVGNNGLGGAGVAYNAKISRLYYGTASEINAAFGFANDLNQIKSNSWGPFDNGRITRIDPLELAGIEDAALNGRGGKGEVIVWAGGNGGQSNNDRVDYDPYGSNRFSIAVGAIDYFDRRSVYSEPGSALMLVTTSDYDFSTSTDPGIFTTGGFNSYTSNFGGTSSSAPIAAGVAALMLQANPQLTWRDVQHVLIRSARGCSPADPSWGFNAAGGGNLRRFSELFGFGAVDAGAATALAAAWTNRPAEESVIGPLVAVGTPIPDNDPIGVVSATAVTGPMLVERAQVVLTATHTSIGQLRVTLTSPGGTEAVLAGTRFDSTFGGYQGYTFTAVKFWEERSAGPWTLRVSDGTPGAAPGNLVSWQLRLHGHTPACACDWDLSGGLSVQDLFDYLGSYFAGSADFGGDGASTLQDLFDFLECWFGGC